MQHKITVFYAIVYKNSDTDTASERKDCFPLSLGKLLEPCGAAGFMPDIRDNKSALFQHPPIARVDRKTRRNKLQTFRIKRMRFVRNCVLCLRQICKNHKEMNPVCLFKMRQLSSYHRVKSALVSDIKQFNAVKFNQIRNGGLQDRFNRFRRIPVPEKSACFHLNPLLFFVML